jgi:hypothetical protein
MATTKKVAVEIDVNLKNGGQDIEKLNDKVNQLTDSEKKLEKQNNKLGTSIEDTSKAAKSNEKANKGMLDTIKALSIVGAISSAFSYFKDKLFENQKVADSLSAAFNTISTIINQFIDIVISVTDKVSKSTNGFDALGKVMSGILTVVLTPFKAIFYEVSIAIGYVQLAWEKLFGDSSQKNIDAINKRIDDAKNNLLITAQNAVEAGKKIYNNFGEAVSSVGAVVSGVVQESSKINVKAIYESSKAAIQLKNNAKLAAAELAGVVEEYDRQAESLRQIRDDENKSITERIEANNKLGEVLDKQSKTMLALADKKIASAKAELAANKSNIDLQAAVIEAENERKGILAQITGLQSEQKVNAVALGKEEIEMNKAKAESDAQLLIQKKQANVELIKNELEKNLAFQALRDEERQSELARLQENINNTKEGTQARVDALIAYNTKKQELDIADAKAAVERIQLEKDRNNAIRELTVSAFDNEIAKIKDEAKIKYELIKGNKEAEIALEQQTNARIAELNQKRINAEIDAYYGAASAIGSILSQSNQNQIADLERSSQERIKAAGENKEAILAIENETAQQKNKLLNKQVKQDKLFAIAEAIINTYKAAAQVFARPTPGDPVTSLSIKISTMVAAIAAGIKNVMSIRKVPLPGGQDATGGNVNAPNINAPIGMQMGTTALQQAQINAAGNAAVQAFVLESDVSGNQERIERLNRAARIQ